MEGEVAKRNLYEAAITGNVARFVQLLEQDPYLVHEVSGKILHGATMHGQTRIVEEITRRHPKFARDLDSQTSSPLHIAAAEGYVEIVVVLVRVAPEMRWWRDGQGMNPVHVAAMNGHVEVLEELLRLDSSPARERLHHRQTVLHLCVKHCRIGSLEVLANKLGDLVDAKDDDGETILHSAARCNDLENIYQIIKYLVGSKLVKKETRNSMDQTALQILRESHPESTYGHLEIEKLLRSLSYNSVYKELPQGSDMTMVVVILIATMAFQAAVSPPGGVWQEDTSSHRAGESVMASTYPKIYKHFVRANTTAFLSSLLTIFLITTRLPTENIFWLLVAMYAAWVSLASITVSYAASVVVLTPNAETKSLQPIISAVVVVSVGICWAIPVVYVGLHIFFKGDKSSPEREDPEL